MSNIDNVNNPSHYTSGRIEVIDFIEDQLTPEEYRGYIKGNVLKYISRERHKNGLEDLKKAQWYLNRLVAYLESEQGETQDFTCHGWTREDVFKQGQYVVASDDPTSGVSTLSTYDKYVSDSLHHHTIGRGALHHYAFCRHATLAEVKKYERWSKECNT